MNLNRFLREALAEHLDFKRIFFIRETRHELWDQYFPKGELMKLRRDVASRDPFRFVVEGIGMGWTAEKDTFNVEILSMEKFGKKNIKVFLGRGTRNGSYSIP